MEPPELNADDWEMLRAVGHRVRARQFDDFTTQGEACGWCRHPIRLRGAIISRTGDERVRIFSTGRLPDGVFLKACGTRRESRCPSCAAMYRGDARHLVRAGLIGGKGVDESVTERPAILLTLTAPSFGAVHSVGQRGSCHPGSSSLRCAHGRPLTCSAQHHEHDSMIGVPLCDHCYDFEGAVLQNACTPELWRRTTIYVLRHVAGALGWTQREAKERIRLSFCRVAEFQRRGVVHLHAVIRADGVDGKLPPLTAEDLARAALSAAGAIAVVHPLGIAHWGSQVDVQLLDRSAGSGVQQVASYVAKYATKSSDGGGALDAPIRSEEDLACRSLAPQLRRMAETAWALGDDPTFEPLRLRHHAHGLGYGGHFLSKSRDYSTSFSALKAARVAWREGKRRGDGNTAAADRSVERRLRAIGAGWANQGEARWAAFQQRQRLEERRLGNEEWYSRTEQDIERGEAW